MIFEHFLDVTKNTCNVNKYTACQTTIHELKVLHITKKVIFQHHSVESVDV